MDGLQWDLATAILRIEQAQEDPNMRDFLLHRLATCDAPRLRRYLDPETLAVMAKVSGEPPSTFAGRDT